MTTEDTEDIGWQLMTRSTQMTADDMDDTDDMVDTDDSGCQWMARMTRVTADDTDDTMTADDTDDKDDSEWQWINTN